MLFAFEVFDPFAAIFGSKRGKGLEKEVFSPIQDVPESAPSPIRNIIDAVNALILEIDTRSQEEPYDVAETFRKKHSAAIPRSLATGELLTLVMRQRIVTQSLKS